MKKLICTVAFFLVVPVFAVVEIGEEAPNLCYTDIAEQKFCLNDYRGQVTVLIYNAGWCGPCNSEMSELAPAVQEFSNQPVTFLSLSGAGWTQGSYPTVQFLKEWKAQHGIPDKATNGISFVVGASPKDFGKSFIAPPLYIPNAAILDQKGILVTKGIDMSVSEIFAQVTKLLKPVSN